MNTTPRKVIVSPKMASAMNAYLPAKDTRKRMMVILINVQSITASSHLLCVTCFVSSKNFHNQRDVQSKLSTCTPVKSNSIEFSFAVVPSLALARARTSLSTPNV